MNRAEAIKYFEDGVNVCEVFPLMGIDVRLESYKLAITALREQEALENDGVCGLCAYNPPSSGDGKPCSYCPATSRSE